jgi:hypothetical protein
MKRNFPITFIAAVMFLVHISCLEFPGMTVIDDPPIQTYDVCNIHIRNISVISGMTFGHGLHIYGQPTTAYTFTYLGPSPQSGIPIDTSIGVNWSTNYWRVERAIDSVVIDSGWISIAPDQWLLIEGDTSGWSCTWSDEPWQ